MCLVIDTSFGFCSDPFSEMNRQKLDPNDSQSNTREEIAFRCCYKKGGNQQRLGWVYCSENDASFLSKCDLESTWISSTAPEPANYFYDYYCKNVVNSNSFYRTSSSLPTVFAVTVVVIVVCVVVSSFPLPSPARMTKWELLLSLWSFSWRLKCGSQKPLRRKTISLQSTVFVFHISRCSSIHPRSHRLTIGDLHCCRLCTRSTVHLKRRMPKNDGRRKLHFSNGFAFISRPFCRNLSH